MSQIRSNPGTSARATRTTTTVDEHSLTVHCCRCTRCDRMLTARTSVARGLGPTCWSLLRVEALMCA